MKWSRFLRIGAARRGDAGDFAAEGVERRNPVLESILRDVFDDL
jgi:hypothetical protein